MVDVRGSALVPRNNMVDVRNSTLVSGIMINVRGSALVPGIIW